MAGLSDLGLRANYWYLNHREQLMKWWVVSFVVLDVLLLTFWAVALLVARNDGAAARRQLEARVGAPLLVAEVRAALALPLTVGTPVAVRSGKGTVDLIVELKNEDEAYVAESVAYRFVYGGVELPARETFLRPGSARFIFESNVPAEKPGTALHVELEGVRWRRPKDPALLGQVAFSTTAIALDRSAVTTTTPPQPAPRLTATVLNDSIFSYRQAEVSVALVNQGRPVAADRILVSDWETFTERQVSAQWIRNVPASAEATVVVQVNPLDRANRFQP